MAILIVLFHAFLAVPAYAASAPSPNPFFPEDNFLLDCGATTVATLSGGRLFKADHRGSSFYSSTSDVKISIPSANVPLPIYLSARIFLAESSYTFPMSSAGWHWVRLHFYPLQNSQFDLQYANFTVTTQSQVLLHNFNFQNNRRWLVKEFLVNITSEHFSLKFSPVSNSFSFVNGIEIVSAPQSLITNFGSALYPVRNFQGLSTYFYETLFRLNVGGPLITSERDNLGRTWQPDVPYLMERHLAKSVSVFPRAITYSKGESVLFAPPSVYASAVQMADARLTNPKFNVTWTFKIELGYGYLIRLHFCDIVSRSLNQLYFDVYINGVMAISGLDLSALRGSLAAPYHKDFILPPFLVTQTLKIQITPLRGNAILNGLEILKMSAWVSGLDGEFGISNKSIVNSKRNTVAAVGFALMFGAFVLLGAILIRRRRWLIPHRGRVDTCKNSPDSQKRWLHPATMGLGRRFSLRELQQATKYFSETQKIGVGGFGNVYLGELDDGTELAVKRRNPTSEQGLQEFQTEIQMLKKIKHKHLVELIGYCHENSELLLVYQYMRQGTLSDHLHGNNFPPLRWLKRLEICIGAAKGLDYLHVGIEQGIIHRDMKSSNILLDDKLTAKISDFGLSKNGPTMDQTHVSTAIKGSWGYLDPEYFMTQELTQKSDVFSFGVVLLEILCGRLAFNKKLPEKEKILAEWAMRCKREGTLERIVDPMLAGDASPDAVKKFAEIAEKCLSKRGVDRPKMVDVVRHLESVLQVQEASSQGKTDDENGSPVAAVVAVPNSSQLRFSA